MSNSELNESYIFGINMKIQFFNVSIDYVYMFDVYYVYIILMYI